MQCSGSSGSRFPIWPAFFSPVDDYRVGVFCFLRFVAGPWGLKWRFWLGLDWTGTYHNHTTRSHCVWHEYSRTCQAALHQSTMDPSRKKGCVCVCDMAITKGLEGKWDDVECLSKGPSCSPGNPRDTTPLSFFPFLSPEAPNKPGKPDLARKRKGENSKKGEPGGLLLFPTMTTLTTTTTTTVPSPPPP